MSKYEDALNRGWEGYDTLVDAMAELAFLEVVKPFCVKRGLKFITGNGEWTCHLPEHKNGHHVEEWDVEDDEEFTAIFKLCNTEVPGMRLNDLGSLMPHYYPPKEK